MIGPNKKSRWWGGSSRQSREHRCGQVLVDQWASVSGALDHVKYSMISWLDRFGRVGQVI